MGILWAHTSVIGCIVLISGYTFCLVSYDPSYRLISTCSSITAIGLLMASSINTYRPYCHPWHQDSAIHRKLARSMPKCTSPPGQDASVHRQHTLEAQMASTKTTDSASQVAEGTGSSRKHSSPAPPTHNSPMAIPVQTGMHNDDILWIANISAMCSVESSSATVMVTRRSPGSFSTQTISISSYDGMQTMWFTRLAHKVHQTAPWRWQQ